MSGHAGAGNKGQAPSVFVEWDEATGSGYMVDGHRYLAHTSAPVDEQVWLTQADVIAGRDTVVEAAIAWISSPRPREPSGRGAPGK